MATTDTALPRRLEGRVSAVASALSAGPCGFLAPRGAGQDASRRCLASLFSLAASLHTARLPYHAKTIETSRARHVTLEQVWGQMHMLLRPVMRRLQENVRHAQRTFGAPVKTRGAKRPRGEDNGNGNGNGEGKGKGEDPTAYGSREEDRGIGRDILSANTSDLGESDLDDEMAQLLAEKRRRRRERAADKKASKGDKSWRYAFGKAPGDEDDEEAEDEEEEEEEEAEEDNAKGAYKGEGRRNKNKNKNKNNSDDDEAAAREEAAALKEMYGDDFDSADADGLMEEEEDGNDGNEGNEGEDPLLEEDLAWDDPSGAFDERDVQYWGRGDMLNPDDAEDFGDEKEEGIDEEEEEGEEGDDNDDEEEGHMTALERERRRERRLVGRLEARRLHGAGQWALRGEVTGRDRPRDALLDESLDFDHAMRAVPVATAAATARLEDRVRRRVLDGRFDDVARRAALSAPGDLIASNANVNANANGRSAHDAEKSKLSLMDLYEKEFLERAQRAEGAEGGAPSGAAEAEPLTEVEKDELRAIHMWRRLAQHLDALSNFHYTPRPVQEDLAARVRAVDGQAPAIAVETVGNFATTRAAALAPQDLFRGADRKYAGVGSAELVPHERRALRRAKKNESSNKRHMKEQRVSKAKKAKQEQRQLTEGTK